MSFRTQDHEALFRAVDYESKTISTAAVGLTSSKYDPGGATRQGQRAKRALITVETDTIRYRIDGIDPSSTEGHLLSSGDVLALYGFENIEKFRAIRSSSSDATIRVTYER